MKILILAQHYAPEDVSGAVLGSELVSDMVARGYEIIFVTCAPNYPKGEVYSGYRNNLLYRENLHGAEIIRVWSYISSHKTFWHRIVNYATFSISAFLGGLASGKPDIILSFSPPLPLGVAAFLLKKFFNVPWILNVQDIYPEIAVVTGIIKNNLAIKILTSLEKFLYRHATLIQVLSSGFRINLINKGVNEDKISIIPVWADTEAVYPMPKQNDFRKKYGLIDKFVVMYAGNLGVNSSLEDIIIAAEKLHSFPEIKFVIVGEGVKKDQLIKDATEKHLENIEFLPYQPRSLFNEMLSAADLSLVSLNVDAHHTSLPSKTFNIMSSGRPLLAICPENSEISNLVRISECGFIVSPGAYDDLVTCILYSLNNVPELDRMGQNGRTYVEKFYRRDYCVGLYEKDILNLVATNKRNREL